MVEEKTIYVPDKAIQEGFVALWKGMFSEIKSSKWLIFQLFLRDIKSMYKQSFVGIFWTLVIPFITLGTFVLLNRSGVFSLGDIDVPYPIFAILGLAFWQIFSAGIIACTNSVTNAGGMIAKINFPREALVFASIGQALIAFLIQIVVVVVFFVYYSFTPHWMILLLPLAFIPVVLLTLGLGLIFSIVNGIMRDLGKIIGILMSFLLFLTPVMYAKPQSGLLGVMTKYNPLYYLVSGPRDLALKGSLSEPVGYFYSVVLAFVLFFLCWMVFHLTETRISERV